MFGRKPRLAIDITLQTEVDRLHSNHGQCLENWREVMEDAYKAALQTGLCLDKLEQGEKVLLRNVTPRGGPRKLRLHWETEVAEVS